MKKILFIIDPIETLNPNKDSTVAMMYAAFQKGWISWITNTKNLSINENGYVIAKSQRIELNKNKNVWYKLDKEEKIQLKNINIIMMRKNPPFNMDYIFATYILEIAEKEGVKVINNPQSLRNINEKLSILNFQNYIPPTIISSQYNIIKSFIKVYKNVILKPLDFMGGYSVFRIKNQDCNTNSILEIITKKQTRMVMVQKFIKNIYQEGDKRILLINGNPLNFALARIPSSDEIRANLSRGSTAIAVPLTYKDRNICKNISSFLKEKGLYFVGLDVIGGYITEINITSPTGIQELNRLCCIDIANQLFEIF